MVASEGKQQLREDGETSEYGTLIHKPAYDGRAKAPGQNSTRRAGQIETRADKPLQSRFARVRVTVAHDAEHHPPKQEWLLVEWPQGEKTPTKYWLSNPLNSISMTKLVDTVKMRWRIERDYQELKQEFGLSHNEGRGWRGFHHHATLTIAAYGFLVAERLIDPSSKKKRRVSQSSYPIQRFPPTAAPLRASRHVPGSIPTSRVAIALALAVRLLHCPCCGRRNL